MTEYPLVEKWLRWDPHRWIAGLFGGIFAACIALLFASFLAQTSGLESTYPLKLLSSILLGSRATHNGNNPEALRLGMQLLLPMGALLGLIFSHFVPSQSLKTLMIMGLVWGVFSWIFIWNLFLQSFPTLFYSQTPPISALSICLVYGLSLSNIRFLDTWIRPSSRAQ